MAPAEVLIGCLAIIPPALINPLFPIRSAIEPDAAPRDDKGDDIATLAIAKVWLERVQVGDEEGCAHALRVARRAWKKFKANPDNIESGNQGYRPISDAEFPE